MRRSKNHTQRNAEIRNLHEKIARAKAAVRKIYKDTAVDRKLRKRAEEALEQAKSKHHTAVTRWGINLDQVADMRANQADPQEVAAKETEYHKEYCEQLQMLVDFLEGIARNIQKIHEQKKDE